MERDRKNGLDSIGKASLVAIPVVVAIGFAIEGWVNTSKASNPAVIGGLIPISGAVQPVEAQKALQEISAGCEVLAILPQPGGENLLVTLKKGTTCK